MKTSSFLLLGLSSLTALLGSCGGKTPVEDRPLDIEWLFVGEELHIVQARPYVVR